MKDLYNILYTYNDGKHSHTGETGWIPYCEAVPKYRFLKRDSKVSDVEVVKKPKDIVTSAFDMVFGKALALNLRFVDDDELNDDILFLVALDEEQLEVFFEALKDNDPSFEGKHEQEFRSAVATFRKMASESAQTVVH